ncbi:MAG: radical SAM protein [Candidatus Helarchaeota archaeon]|nr:radical SAM protein [Candidatus Helarchaeota archaeon]
MKLKKALALFEITNACNMNCIHCYKENLGGKQLSLEEINRIIDKISAFGVRNLILTGGEPLLRNDLFDIIDHAKKRKIRDVVINTNGILLDNSKIVDEIIQRLDVIAGIPVSFDGARSETHDFIRGKGQFVKLMKIFESETRDLPLGMNVTLGKWNFEDFETFFEIYDNLHASDINFGIFIPLGRGEQLKDQVLTPAQCRSLIEMAKEKKRMGYEIELCSLPYANIDTKGLSGACCNIFTEFITVTAEGDMVPCILYDYKCGSILERELGEIFSNPLVHFFRYPKKLKKYMVGYCNTCPKFDLCKGGCKLLTFALKGTIYNSDPSCPLMH